MKIVITNGLVAKETGGPAQYGVRLAEEFGKKGVETKLLSFSDYYAWPTGLRHLLFFLKTLFAMRNAETVLALDTFSVGLPSAVAAWCLRKKLVVRVGGDFLWEAYVNRTKKAVPLSDFYNRSLSFNLKERTIFRLTKFVLRTAETIAFNTAWQRELWLAPYQLKNAQLRVVKNMVPEFVPPRVEDSGYFLWAGRDIPLKNQPMIDALAAFIASEFPGRSLKKVSGLPHAALLEEVRNCHAVLLSSWTDICPNFILEAAAAGKPFIMSSETGLREIYPTGGVYVPPFDTEGWKQAVRDMMNAQFYERRCEEIQAASAREARSWEKVAADFLEICLSKS